MLSTLGKLQHTNHMNIVQLVLKDKQVFFPISGGSNVENMGCCEVCFKMVSPLFVQQAPFANLMNNIMSKLIMQGCGKAILTGPAQEVDVTNAVYNLALIIMLSTTYELCDRK